MTDGQFLNRRPCPKLGEFVEYDGRIWIVVEELLDGHPMVWMVDADGATNLWSDSERSDGSFAASWAPAKPRKLRGELEKAAKRWRKKHGKEAL